MNKTLLITLLSIIGLGFIVLVFWVFGANSKATSASVSNTQPIILPIGGTVSQPSAASPQATNMAVLGSNGASIQTLNFISNPATVPDPINPGYYYLGYHPQEGAPNATATSTPPYVIEYIASTEYFNIALLQEPIGNTRLAAEQYLLTNLGITESQACQLNYMVSVPTNVNSEFAGKSLEFSFCPDAITLPQ
jgi:hypothetical protein